MSKIILDLCAGTGSWSRPYKESGYDVRLISLPYYDVRNYVPPRHVHGVLAAPPCNEFSRAKTTGRNLTAGFEIVKACLEIIWKCKPAWWALENPRGHLIRFLGPPAYFFDPFQFGDPYTKRTWLWGYFKNPIPMIEQKVKYYNFQYISRAQLVELNLHGKTRSDLRSCTPPGFAKAFFKANL